MSNVDDLKRLAEEMADTYEERIRFLSNLKQRTLDIKKDATDLLSEFNKAHSAMSKELKAELVGFKSDLKSAEQERRKVGQKELKSETAQRKVDIENLLDDFDSARRKMAADLRAELARLISDLKLTENERKKDTADLLSELDKAHGAMSRELKAELAGFKSDLESAEKERRKTGREEKDLRKSEATQRRVDIENLLNDSDSARREMTANFRTELARLNDERKAEIREMASAWKKLLSDIQALRKSKVVAGPATVEAEVKIKPVEKVVEEPVEEEKVKDVVADEEPVEGKTEDMEDRILNLLGNNPEGVKMTEIAEILGIENWRSLIPVMRSLLDYEEIRKEGTLYFLS